MKYQCNHKGFTLIEIIVVMLIISLSAGIVIAKLGSSAPGTKLTDYAREMSGTMRYAKSLAQIKGEDMVVTVNMDERTYSFKGKTKKLPEDVMLSVTDPMEGELTSGQWNVTFFAEGGTAGGAVTLYRDKAGFTIVIDPIVGSVINQVVR